MINILRQDLSVIKFNIAFYVPKPYEHICMIVTKDYLGQTAIKL